MNGRDRPGSLAAGFAALVHWRLAALLIACTVLPALMAASSLVPALRASFAETLAGDHVLRNHPTAAPTDVLDFLREQKTAIAGARRAGWVAALVGVVLQIFFAGGFVEVVGRRPRPAVLEFLDGSWRNFWHNLKCFVLFLVSGGIVVGVWVALGATAGRKLFEKTPPGETSTFLYRVGVLLGALLLFAVLSLLHDFSRAARRVGPTIGAFRAYGRARRTLRRRWLRALGLFFFWGVLGALLLAALFSAAWALSARDAGTVFLLFALQLAALCVRPFVRVAAWGSYLALIDAAEPPPPIPSASSLEPEPIVGGSLLDETPLV